MLQDYPVRSSLKQSLKGPHYQVLLALHLLLKALDKRQRVRVMLELAGVGALDDVVIEYVDAANQIQERRYFQQKHANDDEEILKESDLYNKTGKCEVFKYFDDWFFFVRDKIDASSSPCYYFTNRDFDVKAKTYLQENKVI